VLLKFLCMVECIKMQSDISLMASNNHLFFMEMINTKLKTKNCLGVEGARKYDNTRFTQRLADIPRTWYLLESVRGRYENDWSVLYSGTQCSISAWLREALLC
jgi:hypothetical protein